MPRLGKRRKLHYQNSGFTCNWTAVPSVVSWCCKTQRANGHFSAQTCMQKFTGTNYIHKYGKYTPDLPCSNVSLSFTPKTNMAPLMNALWTQTSTWQDISNGGCLLFNWSRALEQRKKRRGMHTSESLEFNEQSHLLPLKGRGQGDESSCFILCAKQNRHLP